MARETSKRDTTITVMVEIPKGSRNKYEYDPQLGRIKLDRMLFSAVHYPSDYGFVVDTLAEDDDPLDALVLVEEPTFPGCFIDARPIGLFKMWDEHGIDDKILCVPPADPIRGHFKRLADVPEHLLLEIQHFFTVYKQLESTKRSGVEGWHDVDAAMESIRACRERYRAHGVR